jgi:hypothetical protein
MAARPLRFPRLASVHRSWLRVIAVVVLCVGHAASSQADIPPQTLPAEEAAPAVRQRSDPLPLQVRQDPRAENPRIVIPAKLLAGLVKPQPGDKAATTQLRSIIAAVALSAAVAAGLVIGRSRQRTSGQRWFLAICGLVSLTAVVVAANTAFADLLPPGGGPRRPRPSPAREHDAEGRPARPAARTIVIEVTQEGDEVLLLLGRNGLPPQ